MQITILTPTYNRANCLGYLFDSLQNQTNRDFQWLIVDDGSTDDTDKLIEGYQKRSSFPVCYIYKENGGKHTALNMGIKMIDTELTFIVDSDDTLTNDAIDTILRYHDKYKERNDICGYSFLRIYPNGEINGSLFPKEEWITTLIEARINSDDTNSDKAEIYRTFVLKQYPFPEFKGEKFLGEDIVWIRIAKKYKMVHINKGIYVGQYLEEGLTNNRRMHNIKSPVGCMYRAIEYMDSRIKLKYRVKGAVQYIIYGKFAGIPVYDLLKDSPYKLLVGAVTIPGLIMYRKWREESKYIEQETKR